MKNVCFESILTVTLAGGLVLGMSSAAAYEPGEMVLRVGAAGVFPDADSDNDVLGVSGGKVDVESAWSLGITFTYMLTDQVGLGVLAAWPFEHDIEGDGALSGAGTVASIKHLPPSLTAQWHIPTASPRVHPYVGAGFNYTTFFDEETEGALNGASLKLDDSWGFAAEAGVDFDLQDDWLLSAQVWYVDIDTDATLTNIPGDGPSSDQFDVQIDPWVFMLGVGKRF